MNELKINPPNAEVGVIVARFQTDQLTDGHKQLLNFVRDHHAKVIILLGLSPLLTTRSNPLDYQARKQMIEKDYPDFIIGYIKDLPSDDVWSKSVDDQINAYASHQSVVLYGSRDSFIPHYHGKHKTQELEPTINVSGTELRESIKGSTRPTHDFRAGVIWAAYNKFDTVIGTVDIAVFNDDESEFLLGRKPFESKWRFIGGFSDVNSESDEQDARREVIEETHLEVGEMTYICSQRIDDWRYRRERDKIRTRFFKTKRIYGAATPDDDIEELKWYNFNTFDRELLVEGHKVLFDKLVEYQNKNK